MVLGFGWIDSKGACHGRPESDSQRTAPARDGICRGLSGHPGFPPDRGGDTLEPRRGAFRALFHGRDRAARRARRPFPGVLGWRLGVAYALVDRRFPAGANYGLAAFAFGAILPTVVALLVVAPLKGGPVGSEADATLLLMALLVNGAWGIGTGVFMRLEQRLLS